MFCPKCGYKLPDNARFCRSCGTEFVIRDSVKNIQVEGNVNVEKVNDIGSGRNIESEIKTIEECLIKGDFDLADKLCQELIGKNPKNGELYLYQLLSHLHCHKRENLKFYPYPIEGESLYKKVVVLGDESVKEELRNTTDFMKTNTLSERKSIARMSIAELKYLKKGSEFTFGMTAEGPIKWTVFEENPNGFSAIMSDVFCTVSYFDKELDYKTITTPRASWDLSFSRYWLNNDFLSVYFDKTEREMLSPIVIEWDPSQNSPSSVDNKTIDHVSLLSLEEVKRLFPTESERNRGKSWFLRSVGINKDTQAVSSNGKIYEKKAGNEIGIRPYIKIDYDRIHLENEFFADEIIPQKKVILKKCPICNTEIPEEARYCYTCGAVQLFGNGGATAAIEARANVARLRTLKKGDVFEFGRFTYGVPLKWRVLENNEESLFVYSEQIVNHMPFGTDKNRMPDWEMSPIRQWLNKYFLDFVLTDEERTVVMETTVDKKKKALLGETKYGETIDRLFLLSAEQCKNYHIKQPGEDYNWLTSTVADKGMVCSCTKIYIKREFRYEYCTYNGGVRPAMYLKKL